MQIAATVPRSCWYRTTQNRQAILWWSSLGTFTCANFTSEVCLHCLRVSHKQAIPGCSIQLGSWGHPWGLQPEIDGSTAREYWKEVPAFQHKHLHVCMWHWCGCLVTVPCYHWRLEVICSNIQASSVQWPLHGANAYHDGNLIIIFLKLLFACL